MEGDDRHTLRLKSKVINECASKMNKHLPISLKKQKVIICDYTCTRMHKVLKIWKTKNNSYL